MIKTIFTFSIGLLSMIFTVTQNCEDLPKFDYESYPNQPFEFEHADIKVTLEPELNLVRGVVIYTVFSKIDGETELILSTEESAIDDVFFNETDIDFRVTNDSLIIKLPDSSKAGEEFSLSITWQANGKFGLYKDIESNFWSSKNPLAHHHWIPIFDHPRNELSFNAYFTIPTETEIMFNGELVGIESVSASVKQIHFKSDTPVPSTGLGFVMGDFVISEITSGLTNVRLFSSELNFAEVDRISLLKEASEVKKKIEKKLAIEYPWEGLNIVVLPDNYWEERTHGTGIIYLYQNLGDLSAQLKRGLYAQWFGEYLRGEQYFNFDNGGYELIRTALHYSIFDESSIIENPDTLNSLYSWNEWQQNFIVHPLLFQNTISNSLPEISRTTKGIFNFDDFAENWYLKTGVSWFDLELNESSTSKELSEEEVKYSLSATYDELSSVLNLTFKLEEGSGDKLYSLTMTEFSFDDSTNHEINFTGESDEVTITISNTVDYVSFSDGSISVDQITYSNFPVLFLLNQLRSTKPSDRVNAAKLLSKHADTPDLQLALDDVMNFENNASVKAAILETLAVITNGATGTEQEFLEGLNNAELEIQKASIHALTNYVDNEIVKNALRNKIYRTENAEIFNLTLESYSQLATSEEIITVAKRLQRIDTTGLKTLIVVNDYANPDTLEAFISIADQYITTSYAYNTRKKALQFLAANDIDSNRWISRFKSLLVDRDPRVRMQALKAVKWLSPTEALKILGNVERNEYDVRILLEVDNLLEQMSD